MTLNLDLLKVSKMTHNYDLFKVLIIHKVSKIRQKKKYKNFCAKYENVKSVEKGIKINTKKKKYYWLQKHVKK